MSAIISFVIKHLPAIILAALIAIIAWQFYSITSERDESLNTIANMQLEANKKNAQVALLKQQGIRDTKALQASYNEIVAYLLKGNKDDKKTIVSKRDDLDNRLRKQSENSAIRLPSDDENRSAGKDGYGVVITEGEESEGFYKKAYLGAREYIDTLEQAGAVAAADYNACKSYVDSEQERIGVYAD